MSDPMARYVQFCAGLLEAVSALLDVDPAPVPTQPEPQPLWINVAATLEMHASVRHGRHHNANKLKCKRGHEFTQENTRLTIKPNGRTVRHCRICIRGYQQERRIAA